MLTGLSDSNCSLFSPRFGCWYDGPSMPTERDSHCSAPLGGVSVVCAGEDDCGRPLSSTLLLPAGDAAQWTRGCEMVSARSGPGGAVVGAVDANPHRLLAVGGWASNRCSLDSCELYDAAADRWSLQEARLPQAMRCRAAPIAGGSAVLAVQSDDGANTRCALLDVRSSSASWQPMVSAAAARCYHDIAVVGDYSVVMLGGGKGNVSTDTTQLYDARADRWSERAEWRLPALSSSHCAAVI